MREGFNPSGAPGGGNLGKRGFLPYNTNMNDVRMYISINPQIRFGKPCINGTRITVGDILQWLSSGMTEQEIVDDYPELQKIHIRAALAFA